MACTVATVACAGPSRERKRRYSAPNGQSAFFTDWAAILNACMAQTGLKPRTKSFDFSLTNPNTTHRFIWDARRIRFQSQYGHRNDSLNLFQNWLYTLAAYTRFVPQKPMPVHINLWLMLGRAPLDGKPVTVVIKSFKFTPK